MKRERSPPSKTRHMALLYMAFRREKRRGMPR